MLAKGPIISFSAMKDTYIYLLAIKIPGIIKHKVPKNMNIEGMIPATKIFHVFFRIKLKLGKIKFHFLSLALKPSIKIGKKIRGPKISQI